MKIQHRFHSGSRRLIGALSLAAALTLSCSASAYTYLWQGETEVGIGYRSSSAAWDLHVHSHDAGEFEPDEVVLGVDIVAARQSVPPGARWSFLGAAGAPVWILPEIQSPEVLFLGISAQEVEFGLFANHLITLSLAGVSGPGDFSLYATGMFGDPIVIMNSAGGAPNALNLLSGSHLHPNWAFTAPGTYEVSFSAAGTLIEGGPTSSGPVTFRFEVAPIPEPGTATLLGLGLAALALARGRRARTA